MIDQKWINKSIEYYYARLNRQILASYIRGEDHSLVKKCEAIGLPPVVYKSSKWLPLKSWCDRKTRGINYLRARKLWGWI